MKTHWFLLKQLYNLYEKGNPFDNKQHINVPKRDEQQILEARGRLFSEKKKHEVLNGRTAKPMPPLGVIGKKGKIPWQYNHPARNQAIYFSALEWTHLITNNIIT